MSNPRLNEIKEQAAKKAMEVYGEELLRLGRESGVLLWEMAHSGGHACSGVLFSEDEEMAVSVRTQFEFSTDPDVLIRTIRAEKL